MVVINLIHYADVIKYTTNEDIFSSTTLHSRYVCRHTKTQSTTSYIIFTNPVGLHLFCLRHKYYLVILRKFFIKMFINVQENMLDLIISDILNGKLNL
jgi:hypothetical protein